MKKRTILIILVSLAAVIAGCMTVPEPCIIGSGNQTVETKNLTTFEKISLTMPATLTVLNGDTFSVRIEADDNILPYIRTDVRSRTLVFSYNRPCIHPGETVKITVTSPVINEVEMTGTGSVSSDGVLKADHLAIRITGAGDMDLEVETSVLSTSIMGTGNVNLKGTADDHHVSLPGAGTIDASELRTVNTTVEIFGSGDMKVNATETLTVKITGRGSVLYTGNPRIDQSITGTGSVRQMTLPFLRTVS